MTGPGFTHGTLYGYRAKGCRCEKCTERHRSAVRERMRRHRQRKEDKRDE